MIIIKSNPKNWKLTKHVMKDGKIEYADYDSHYLGQNGSKVLEDNFIFSACLIPSSFYRGRSAAGFIFLDSESGIKLTMRIAKLEELLKALANGSVKLSNGGFEGVFTFFKQGSNYSIGIYKKEK